MGMSYLLDTHILLWWLFNDPKLNTDCQDIIRNPDHRIFVSSASAWEVAIKYRSGKLPKAKQLIEEYPSFVSPAGENLKGLEHVVQMLRCWLAKHEHTGVSEFLSLK